MLSATLTLKKYGLWKVSVMGLQQMECLCLSRKSMKSFLIISRSQLTVFSFNRKREHSDVFHPSKVSISYWEVLLRHVHSMHSEFPSVLCRRFVLILLSLDRDTKDIDQRPDPSYDTYLACWAKWAVDTWGGTAPSDLQREVLSTLMKGIFSSPFPLQKRPA